MSRIYRLACRDGRFYVGKSTRPDLRIQKHYLGKGAKWTKQYRPLSALAKNQHVAQDEAKEFDEELEFYLTAKRYGLEKVRGASYCLSEPWEEEQKEMQRLLDTAIHCPNTPLEKYFIILCKTPGTKESNTYYWIDVTSLSQKEYFQKRLYVYGDDWPAIYQTTEIVEFRPATTIFDHHILFLQTVKKCGSKDQVRCGNNVYAYFGLTDTQAKMIDRAVWNEEGKCMICGAKHKMKRCPKRGPTIKKQRSTKRSQSYKPKIRRVRRKARKAPYAKKSNKQIKKKR